MIVVIGVGRICLNLFLPFIATILKPNLDLKSKQKIKKWFLFCMVYH